MSRLSPDTPFSPHDVFTVPTLSDLPVDVLVSIFSYIDPRDHFSLMATCRRLNSLYTGTDCEAVWQKLSYQYFPHESRVREQKLALLPAVESPPTQSTSSPHPQLSWRQLFRDCSHTLTGLNSGCFCRTSVWEHPIPSSPLLVDYQVFELGGIQMFMERSVAYSGQTRFLFRSLTTEDYHFDWKINASDVFEDFSPLTNRIHCDIRVKNRVVILAFYSTNGVLSRLYHWTVSSREDLRAVSRSPLSNYWSPDSLTSLLSPPPSPPSTPTAPITTHPSLVPSHPLPKDTGTSARLLRLQPPFAALQTKHYFVLVNILSNEIIHREGRDVGQVQTCRWDASRLIFLAKGPTGQSIHIIQLRQLAVGFSSEMDRFSHPHLERDMHSTRQQRVVIPCRYKLSGGYLDFYHSSTGLAIFASTVTRTFCKIYVGSHCRDPLTCTRHPLSQSLFVIEKESRGPSDTTAFTTPKGLLFGNNGPFIAFSDGCDIYWFVDRGAKEQPVARKVRVGQGQKCSGHHQVVILGSSLLHICSKHAERVREVSLYEPCTSTTRSSLTSPRRYPLAESDTVASTLTDLRV